MKLTEARVRTFKSVADSTPIRVEEDVTALVGKNESGKTAVLQALYRVKPLSTGNPTTFEELRDYPRRTFARDRKAIPTAVPVEAVFAIDDDDVSTFEARFGAGTLATRTVTVSRRYGSRLPEISACANAPELLRLPIEKAGLAVDTYLKPAYDQTVAALRQGPEAAVTLAAQLEAGDLREAARNFVWSRVPGFQYFDEYSILPGSVSVERLQTVSEEQLSASERTALAFLRLAGVEEAEFTAQEYEARKAALEAAANQVTDELFE